MSSLKQPKKYKEGLCWTWVKNGKHWWNLGEHKWIEVKILARYRGLVTQPDFYKIQFENGEIRHVPLYNIMPLEEKYDNPE